MTLDYATCLALKEAGFPQKHVNPWKSPYQPGLSELIAEMPLVHKWDGGFALMYTGSDWRAGYRGDDFWGDTYAEGPTPKAACAALYLAIHGKENV